MKVPVRRGPETMGCKRERLQSVLVVDLIVRCLIRKTSSVCGFVGLIAA